MRRIYLASPFFDEEGYEVGLVEKVEALLHKKGLHVFSPMRNQMDDFAEVGSREWSLHTFMNDVKYLDWCDYVVAIYHGNYSDSGTAWEMGYAYATNKPVITVHVGDDSNLMCHEGSFANLTIEELEEYSFISMPSNFYKGKML